MKQTYPPGNSHIPPWEKENHLQNAIFGGYVSSLEGIPTKMVGEFLPVMNPIGRKTKQTSTL